MKFQTSSDIVTTTDVEALKAEYEALVDQVSALQVDFSTLSSNVNSMATSFSTEKLTASTSFTTPLAQIIDLQSSTMNADTITASQFVRSGNAKILTPFTTVSSGIIPLFKTSSSYPFLEAIVSLTTSDGTRYPFIIKSWHNVLMACGLAGTIKNVIYNGENYYYLYSTSITAGVSLSVEVWSNGDAVEALSDATYYNQETVAAVTTTSLTEVAISGQINVNNTSISFANATINTLTSTTATIATLNSTNLKAANANITTGNITTTTTGSISNSGNISTNSLAVTNNITAATASIEGIGSTNISTKTISATDSITAPNINASTIKYTGASFNKDSFIDIPTPSSNTDYNLIELPSFVGLYNVVLTNTSGQILFSSAFTCTNSTTMANPSTLFTYSTNSINSFASVEYADDKIYIKTYSGGKLYYSYDTVDASSAPETYSSINLPNITTVYYSVDITKLSNSVFFGKGITIKGTVEADSIANPSSASYENMTINKSLSIGTTLSVSNGTGSIGQILDVNEDGHPQWSMPTGYTYVIKNKAQFLKWAFDSLATTSTVTNDYKSVLIDLDEPVSLSDGDFSPESLGRGGYVNCTNCGTKLVYMSSASASLTFADSTEFTASFYCTNTDIKFVNLRIESDAHMQCINGAGLVDRCYIKMAATTHNSYGLEKCSLVTDCDIISNSTSSYSAYGVDACKAVVNTSVISTGAYGYGYSYCTNIVNCIDRGSTTYGFIGCINTLNTTGTETQCTTTIGKASNMASLYGNITNPNVTGTMPIGANYASYDGVDPTTLFGGYWKIIQAI